MITETMIPATTVALHNPGLATWSVYDPAIRVTLDSAALLTSAGWWLVDPSPIEDEVIRRLLGSRSPVGILLTNANHERSAWDLSGSLDCAVFAQEAAQEHLQIHPEHLLWDGEETRGWLKVISLPGAAKGECCFYHREKSIVLMGDALIHMKDKGLSILPDKYCDDPALLRTSLRRLLEFQFEIMTFAHGSPILTGARAQVEKLLAATS